MKKLLFTSLFTVIAAFTFAQFEGVIQFEKTKGDASTKYSYFIGPDKVRIEEMGSDGKLKGVMLVDLKTNTLTSLSPERKIYMDATNHRPQTLPKTKLNKTGNKKNISGYDCTEWVVSNDLENTQISYWVVDKGFDFFTKLLKALNRKDKLSTYYLSNSGIEGTFTMMGTEKDMMTNSVTELKVTKIEKKAIDKNMFVIPEGYQKFEK